MGMGGISLAAMFGMNPWTGQAATSATAPATGPLAPKKAPLPCKAKAVIHLFASGGPSQVDTWDPKPELTKQNDKTIPGHDGLAFGSPFQYTKSGKSGVEVSSVFPQIGTVIDELAVIRSLWTDIPAHEVAQRFMNTGALQLPEESPLRVRGRSTVSAPKTRTCRASSRWAVSRSGASLRSCPASIRGATSTT